MDHEYKTLRLAFGSAAKADSFAAIITDRGYNRDPLQRTGDRIVSFVFKAALEDEVQAIVRAHGGYVPAKPQPLWPSQGQR